MGNTLIMFIHLLAAGIGVGSLIFAVLVFLPAMEKSDAGDTSDDNPVLLKTMDMLPPMVFACILALILSGILYLSENYTEQVNFSQGYYNLLGTKMAFVVVVFFLSAYQTFNLRGRLSNLDLNPEQKKQVPQTLKKMQTISRINLGTMTLIFYIGVWLARFQ
ncbi:MAG: CopD family protein [Nitrospinales bacterium]